MIEGFTQLTDFQPVITDQDDVGFYHPPSKRFIKLYDAASVRKVVDDDIADLLEYEE